jgi:membrane associated rhomboid family serine protease
MKAIGGRIGAPMTDDNHTAIIQDTILDGLSQDIAETYALVLSSAGMGCRIEQTSNGWRIKVAPQFSGKALSLIEMYRVENRPDEDPPDIPSWPIKRTYAAIWMGLILVATHLFVLNIETTYVFRRHFNASAERILSGEWYRTATALFLHADNMHLIGNVMGLGLFATAVCSTAGFGVGTLMILVAGMAGNFCNAFFFQTGHHAIGASTAVFGALGISAAHQFVMIQRRRQRRFQSWVALGGGLALLGMLGSGLNTDLTAHLFGFIAGLSIGILFSAPRYGPPGQSAQWGCLLVAMLLVIASFAIP